ncbi:MAG: MFS transporter [Lachnospiraceae bacterium]|nr:MFS transporter [Lachnospiraceae bacterium]
MKREREKADVCEQGRRMYIWEAALEYLISILVAGSYLATLTRELGISDSLTGILSSVISLGCLFQLLSITYRRKQVKSMVIAASVVNQLLFMLLYVIPLSNAGKQMKIVLFVITIFLAYLIYNFAHPKKINWLMSLVEDGHRGSFTASKEMVSLVVGMIFSFVMGTVIDHFSERGEVRTAFILTAVVIFILMLLHTLTMVLTAEKPMPEEQEKKLLKNIAEVIRNKNVLRVTVIFILYHIAIGASHPFYGTYQIGELGFGLQFVSLLSIISSIVRIIVSKFWGYYADKKSFAAMMEKCFAVLALSMLSVVFAVPANGNVMFVLYYIFNGIALGGINSALTNLIFDYVQPQQRADSLAICQAFSGLAGFLTTLAVSALVSRIQGNGNYVLGIPIYAQQLISLIGVGCIVIALIYIRLVIMRKCED